MNQNGRISAIEHLATDFWSSMLIHCRKEGCDQFQLYPTGDRYSIRLHDHHGWRELDMRGWTVDFPKVIPHLKTLVGRSAAADILPPGARCMLRLAPKNQFEITVTTRRTESGAEEVHLYLLLEPQWRKG